MNFKDIDINLKLKQKIIESGFTDLTVIQERCIPEILDKRDVVGQAETGSGKTLAFCLPILDKIQPGQGLQVVVLTPTRELCQQVSDVFIDFGKNLGIGTVSVFGGVSIEPQIRNIRASEIVVATPGRMLDHIGRRTIDFRSVKFLVLDETDKMLDMGFIDDVERIISFTPRDRQTLMFSATIENSIHRLIKRHLRTPVVIKTQSQVDKSKLEQIYYDIYQQNNKFSILLHLLKNDKDGLSIVFCATRRESDVVARNLRHHGVNALAIHGGMSQNKRTRSLDSLRNQRIDVLVATDVAARGLDIKNVTHIYHYDVPKTSTEYIHRIGRTARAGENGKAVTLLTEPDHDNFRRVQSNDELEIEEADIPDFKKVSFFRKSKHNKRSFRKQSWKYQKRGNRQV
jgi:ATP-dependent RNA helicase DeaD